MSHNWHDWNLFTWGQSRSLLPKSSGVYVFVGTDGAALYVGASGNIWNRVRKHEIVSQLPTMDGVKVYWKGCSTVALRDEEEKAILNIKPVHNAVPYTANTPIRHYGKTSGTIIAITLTPEEDEVFLKLRAKYEAIFGVVKASNVMRIAIRNLASKHGILEEQVIL